MEGNKTRSVSITGLPLWLAAVAIVLGFSGLLRGPLSFVIFFGVMFGLLMCLRAVVRARAKRKEA